MTHDLSANPYLQDILAQPQALRDTLAGLAQTAALRSFSRRLLSGSLRRIVLTGMGSSYHALHPLLLTLIGRGLTAQMIETSELIHYAPALLEPKTLIIAVSQSGRSAEIIQLLAQTKGRAPLIAVTNSPDSPLAAQADAAVFTRAGEEFSVSCKTYSTALAALAWLGDALTGRSPSGVLAELAPTADLAAAYLSAWEKHVALLCERLTGIRQITFVGRGPSLAAVGTAALTTKESAHFPAEGMSSAAFRHGPLEMINPRQFVLVYTGPAATAVLNRRLAADINADGGRAALVGPAADLDAFILPSTPGIAAPILEILPAQLITLALAQLSGHEAGRFERAHKITTIE